MLDLIQTHPLFEHYATIELLPPHCQYWELFHSTGAGIHTSKNGPLLGIWSTYYELPVIGIERSGLDSGTNNSPP